MKLEGRATLPGTREQVWEIFTDPARLAKILPGCESLEEESLGRYRVAVKFGIAAISGKYAGTISLLDEKKPESLRMKIESKGSAGFVTGSGQIELHEKAGSTEVHYSGEAVVGGLIASVGQRMIEAAAKTIVQQVFASAASQITSTE
ncbi:MAG: SRPBCC family protein [Candidatus Acidiferrales bacterium]